MFIQRKEKIVSYKQEWSTQLMNNVCYALNTQFRVRQTEFSFRLHSVSTSEKSFLSKPVGFACCELDLACIEIDFDQG